MIVGIVFGLGSIGHGIFEVLQGNEPTPGLFIEAISESQRYWEHGAEGAFSILPTYLAAGIGAIITGMAAIAWSITGLKYHWGHWLFLFIFILSFLSGGGVAQVAFFLPAWAFGSRMYKPLRFWSRVLPARARPVLVRLWPWLTGIATVGMVFALQMATFGWLPGVSHADTILVVMLAIVGVCVILFPLAFVASFAEELIRREE